MTYEERNRVADSLLAAIRSCVPKARLAEVNQRAAQTEPDPASAAGVNRLRRRIAAALDAAQR